MLTAILACLTAVSFSIGAPTQAKTDFSGRWSSDPDPAAAPAHAVRIPERGAPPQVFPDSSRRRLTQTDVAPLSPARIRLARNEIFARHGRTFQDAQLRRHFELYPWYRPSPSPTPLTAVEQANIHLLRQAESK